jgi:trans-L-3-hydroxyproline dehydratase
MRTRRVISVVGCHAEGERGDVIVGGVLPPAGGTMFARMQAFACEHDNIRRLLINEPRGSICRHLNLITPPARADCQAGVIIMEPTEYPPMSGSNLICAVTVLLETGIVPMTEPETVVTMDTPAGSVRAVATCREGRCQRVEFHNVPCFAERLDATLEVDGFGSVSADIAYGGMFYAIVDATKLGFAVTADEARDLASLGERVRLAARAQLSVVHPENPEIAGVSIVQLTRPFAGVGAVTRNTCIVAPGRSDRSPTGTGTCARMAVLHARGQMRVGDTMVHESLIGSRFTGRIAGETTVAGRKAIIPTIAGRAWITGLFNYFIDPDDPWPEGFALNDMLGVTGRLTQ